MTIQIRNDDPSALLRAIYFSEKYGLVFGTTDFTINFNKLELSQSKLGPIYEIPKVRHTLVLSMRRD